MNITDAQAAFVQEMAKILQQAGIRVQEDLRNEKIGFKIREHTIQRIPYLLIVGEREVTHNLVAVRTRNGIDLGSMTVKDFLNKLSSEITDRVADV